MLLHIADMVFGSPFFKSSSSILLCSHPSSILRFSMERTTKAVDQLSAEIETFSLSKRAHVSNIKTCVFMLIHHPPSPVPLTYIWHISLVSVVRMIAFHHTLSTSNSIHRFIIVAKIESTRMRTIHSAHLPPTHTRSYDGQTHDSHKILAHTTTR